MEDRVALIGIILESEDSIDKVNSLLSEYRKHIIGRMGIPYDKKEQHYRFNMFHDMTKDRSVDIPMWLTESNGYIRTINPNYLDLNKPVKEQKSIRHYHNSILLRKNISDNSHFITKYQNFKITNSSL